MFSQNEEEKYILEYFGDHVGVFADIGCNDCQTFSNTRALALKGWSGVLVDPSPQAIKRCKDLYKGSKTVYPYSYAISDHNGTATLEESGNLVGAADIGLVSTFHAHEKKRFERTVKYQPVEVKTYTWKTALNRWKFKKFDFISIDVESDEMNILPDIDFSETKLLCIEHNGKADLKRQYIEVTSKYGLDKIIYESGENIIIAR